MRDCLMLPGRAPRYPVAGFAKCAFTLIELLTVIAVVGVLTGIVVSSVSRVRDRSGTSRCAANLRQWHQATLLYAAEEGEKLPVTAWSSADPGRDGFRQLRDYIGVASEQRIDDFARFPGFYCPTDLRNGNPRWRAYGFNAFISEAYLSTIADPSRQAWIMDMPADKRWIDYTIIISGNDAALKTAAPRPHSGKLNLVYIDGHVESRKLSEVSRADFTRSSTAYSPAHEAIMVGSKAYDR